MTTRAATAARVELPRLQAGAAAELIVVDPRQRWKPTAQMLRSRAKHTPLGDVELQGRVRATVIDGRVIHESEAAPA